MKDSLRVTSAETSLWKRPLNNFQKNLAQCFEFFSLLNTTRHHLCTPLCRLRLQYKLNWKINIRDVKFSFALWSLLNSGVFYDKTRHENFFVTVSAQRMLALKQIETGFSALVTAFSRLEEHEMYFNNANYLVHVAHPYNKSLRFLPLFVYRSRLCLVRRRWHFRLPARGHLDFFRMEPPFGYVTSAFSAPMHSSARPAPSASEPVMFQNNTNNIEHRAITTENKNDQWRTQNVL